MIRSKLILCAERVIRDGESGSISIINVIDDISAESFPIIIQKFSIINYLIKDSNEDSDKPNIHLKVYNNTKMLGDHQLKIDFRGKLKTRSIIQLGGIPFSDPGEASFVITDNQDNEIDKYVITLHLREVVAVHTE